MALGEERLKRSMPALNEWEKEHDDWEMLGRGEVFECDYKLAPHHLQVGNWACTVSGARFRAKTLRLATTSPTLISSLFALDDHITGGGLAGSRVICMSRYKTEMRTLDKIPAGYPAGKDERGVFYEKRGERGLERIYVGKTQYDKIAEADEAECVVGGI